MNSYKYIPLCILIFFLLKYLLLFLENRLSSLKSKIELFKIESGMLSINDLQKNNYKRFIDSIKLYLSTHGYENIIFFANGSWELTNIIGRLNQEDVLISCIQNINENDESDNKDINDCWQLTDVEDVQRLLARIHQYRCKKGILINNSTFTNDAINFVDKFNVENTKFQIKLVDGYELTRAVRNYKYLNIKES